MAAEYPHETLLLYMHQLQAQQMLHQGSAGSVPAEQVGTSSEEQAQVNAVREAIQAEVVQQQMHEYMQALEAHGGLKRPSEEELKAVAKRQKSGLACRFNAVGRCKQGDDCKFSHNAEAVSVARISGTLQLKSPCRFNMLGDGMCRNGDSCVFSHDPQVAALALAEGKSIAVNRPCRYAMQGVRRCRDGDACPFSHDPELIAAKMKEELTGVPCAVSSGKFRCTPCKFFNLGRCTKGAECTFLHDPNQMEVLQPFVIPSTIIPPHELQELMALSTNGVPKAPLSEEEAIRRFRLANEVAWMAAKEAQASGKGGPAVALGNWTCPQCSSVNGRERESCNRCFMPKEETEAPTSAYEQATLAAASMQKPRTLRVLRVTQEQEGGRTCNLFLLGACWRGDRCPDLHDYERAATES